MDKSRKTLNGIPIPYELAVEELRQQLYPAGPNAWAACLALGYNPSPEALVVLLELLDSKDWRYQGSALEAMVHHPLAKIKQERILPLLDDPSVFVKRKACEAAGQLKVRAALPQLLSLLKSKEVEIRRVAIRALVNVWEPDLLEPVLKVFLKDSSDAVRKEAGWTLKEVANETNWSRIFDIFKNDPVIRHREWACKIAKQFGHGQVNSDLLILQTDRDGHVRKAARAALDKDYEQ